MARVRKTYELPAETSRGDPEQAKTLSSTPEQTLFDPDVKTAFDVFGSDLPGEALIPEFWGVGNNAQGGAALGD